jgi:ABC-type branched-subunit amino acid transport system ATPase component
MRASMPATDMAPILSVGNLSTDYGKKQVLFDVNLPMMPQGFS